MVTLHFKTKTRLFENKAEAKTKGEAQAKAKTKAKATATATVTAAAAMALALGLALFSKIQVLFCGSCRSSIQANVDPRGAHAHAMWWQSDYAPVFRFRGFVRNQRR